MHTRGAMVAHPADIRAVAGSSPAGCMRVISLVSRTLSRHDRYMGAIPILRINPRTERYLLSKRAYSQEVRQPAYNGSHDGAHPSTPMFCRIPTGK